MLTLTERFQWMTSNNISVGNSWLEAHLSLHIFFITFFSSNTTSADISPRVRRRPTRRIISCSASEKGNNTNCIIFVVKPAALSCPAEQITSIKDAGWQLQPFTRHRTCCLPRQTTRKNTHIFISFTFLAISFLDEFWLLSGILAITVSFSPKNFGTWELSLLSWP